MLRKVFIALMAVMPVAAAADESRPPAELQPSATLPLAEVLRLHRALDDAQKEPAPPAPVDATVSKLVFDGRLLDDAVELTAQVELAVLGEGRWVQVPLLVRDKTTHLAELPSVPGAEFVIKGGSLWFVTDKAGRYTFELKLLKAAELDGLTRAAGIAFSGASLALMNLHYDEGLFALDGGRALPGGEGRVLFPSNNRFEVRWTRLSKAAPESVQVAKRPPTESVITSAKASSVATLEGLRITRVRYALRFEGTKPIAVDLPEGQKLTKVYLNGAAIPFQVSKGRLSLEVAPERAGDQAASLELVLTQHLAGFHLSGELAFAFPAASWSVNELTVQVHLPKVFNYRWTGGSLEPAQSQGPADFTHQIPTPSKSMTFRQQLVGRAPDVRIGYTVDLAGQFWRGHQAFASQPPAVQPAPARAAAVQPVEGRGLAQWEVEE